MSRSQKQRSLRRAATGPLTEWELEEAIRLANMRANVSQHVVLRLANEVRGLRATVAELDAKVSFSRTAHEEGEKK